MWPAAMKEQENWLNSKESNAGVGLYRAVEEKIMAEFPRIKSEREKAAARRRQLVSQYWNAFHGQQRHLSNVNTTQVELENEQSIFSGDSEDDDKVYVYLASDNERVKSAIAEYLLGHKHIALMRVRSDHHIVHAKNLEYLKRNTTGVMNLVLDWYCMSLSNIVFAWRRDTHLLSTFAQVSDLCTSIDIFGFLLLIQQCFHMQTCIVSHRALREFLVMEMRSTAISTAKSSHKPAIAARAAAVEVSLSERAGFSLHSIKVGPLGRSFDTQVCAVYC